MEKKDGISIFKRGVKTSQIVAAVAYNRRDRDSAAYIEFSTCVVVDGTPEHGSTPDPEVNALHCDFNNSNDYQFIKFLDDISNEGTTNVDKMRSHDMQPYWDKYDNA